MNVLLDTFVADAAMIYGSFLLYALLGPRAHDLPSWWSTVAKGSLHAALLAWVYLSVRERLPSAAFFSNGPLFEAVASATVIGAGYLFGQHMVWTFSDRPEWVPEDD